MTKIKGIKKRGLSKRAVSSALIPSEYVGFGEDNGKWMPMSVIICCFVAAAIYCIVKLNADSFMLFGYNSAEPEKFSFTKAEITAFYAKMIIGCLLICAVNALPIYSGRSTIILFSAYVLYFGAEYQAVANGCVRAINRVEFAEMSVLGKTPSQYYLTDFPPGDPKKELLIFLYAVIFGLCFILAHFGVKSCSMIVFSFIALVASALPLEYDCMTSERYFIALVVICILMYTAGVQGCRRASDENIVTRIGSKFRVAGRYSAFAIFEQTLIMMLCVLISAGLINLSTDFPSYNRSEKEEKLVKNIMYTVDEIVSGTFFEGYGFGISTRLNNGLLSRVGNIEYTGKVMFDIRTDHREVPMYLRSFSAADYTGKKWAKISNDVYRASGFWDEFADEGYYPQFYYPIGRGGSSEEYINVTIKNRDINHKIVLTDERLFPKSNAELLNITSYKYDSTFTFKRFGGEDIYKQKLVLPDNSAFNIYPGDPGAFNGESIREMFYSEELMQLSASDTYISEDDEIAEKYARYEYLYRTFAADNYLSYPDNIESWLPEDFDSTMSEYYNMSLHRSADGSTAFFMDEYYRFVCDYIRDFLSESAEYTLFPGRTPSGEDFIAYFVNENHKGYCVHFATAAVVMLRRAGIPARYAEGYYISQEDLQSSGMGEYASIPDSRGHAWAEVYYPMTGWVAAEFTPYYTDGKVPDENRETDESNSDKTTDSDTETDSNTETDTNTETDSNTEIDSNTDTETNTSVDDDEPTEAVSKVTGSAFFAKFLDIMRRIMLIVLVIVMWLLLRYAVCRIRRYRFTQEDGRKAASAMYLYVLKLLRLMKIEPENGEGDEAFAARVPPLAPGINSAQMKDFSLNALSARFGRNPPPNDELKQMLDFVDTVSAEMYKSKPKWKKWIIKYIFFYD